MRRTQAQQTFGFESGPEFRLSEAVCRVCLTSADVDGAVYAMGRNDNGAIERAYCCIDHARTEGWPWLSVRKAS